MKIMALVGLFVVGILGSLQAEWVNGYLRKDGTYVPGYYRTDRNSNPYDNFSYQKKERHNPYYYQIQPTNTETYEYTAPRTDFCVPKKHRHKSEFFYVPD